MGRELISSENAFTSWDILASSEKQFSVTNGTAPVWHVEMEFLTGLTFFLWHR